MKKIILAILSILVIGCADFSLRVSSDFKEHQIEGIIDGARMWCDANIHCFKVSIVPPSEANIIPKYERWPNSREDGRHYALKNIFGDLISDKIELGVWLTREETRCIMAHELGHALNPGAKHTDKSSALMSSKTKSPNCNITPHDVEWLFF